MAITIQSKQDYSYLFSGLSTSGSGSSALGNLNFLSDYAAIKNGSYGKLMKAYYAEADVSKEVSKLADKKTTSTSKDDADTLARMEKATDALKESADALFETGKDSVFKDGDMKKVYEAVDAFVKDYNSVLEASDKVNSESVLKKVSNMVNITDNYAKALSGIGVTVNEDNTLSINKDTFMKAGETAIKNLFNKSGSFGYSMSAQASFINFATQTEASKANTYTGKGAYASNYTSGSIFDSLF